MTIALSRLKVKVKCQCCQSDLDPQQRTVFYRHLVTFPLKICIYTSCIVQLLGALTPDPHQGLCSWTPLGDYHLPDLLCRGGGDGMIPGPWRERHPWTLWQLQDCEDSLWNKALCDNHLWCLGEDLKWLIVNHKLSSSATPAWYNQALVGPECKRW